MYIGVDGVNPRAKRKMPTSFGVSGQNPPILCSVEFIFFTFQYFVVSLEELKQTFLKKESVE
jgi:hypothetical protein